MEISTIKGTAKSGKKARVLIQRTDLEEWGFPIGQPITIEYKSDRIIIAADENGTRKVAKVTDNRRGVECQTFDIKFPAEQRDEMFKGAERLSVDVVAGIITIRAKA